MDFFNEVINASPTISHEQAMTYQGQVLSGLAVAPCVVKADGSKGAVWGADVAEIKYDDLKDAVGGYIEIVQLFDGWIMVCNEEGLLSELPINPVATTLYSNVCGYQNTTPICGDVVVCLKSQVK